MRPEPQMILRQLAYAGAITLMSGLLATAYLHATARGEVDRSVYRSVAKNCISEMQTKVVDRKTATAYCYCYAEKVTEAFSTEDFQRMGQFGATRRDQSRFKDARRACRPPKPKKN